MELELLKHEVAQLRADGQQKAALLEQKAALQAQQAAVLEQQDALLAEQAATIAKQEAKLEAQQLEINRLLQQAFGRRCERYLESPQQLKLDFGAGPEVTDAADGLQQAIDENRSDVVEDAVSVPAHQRKPKKAELMSFVRSQASTPNGGWKAALKDPDTAAAMRALQRRVKKLDDFDAPPPPPWVQANDWSYR